MTQQQQNDEGETKNGQRQEPLTTGRHDVRPFSNGTEGYDWVSANCERCAKNGEYDANGKGPCPMETAISMGFIIGTVPAKLAAKFGATVNGSYCRMPRECSQFAPNPTCEWIAWPGTRRRHVCGDPMVATVDANGRTRAVCAKHLKRATAEHPERAPVPAVDRSWSTPASAVEVPT